MGPSTTTVAIEAVEVGSASTSAPNTITALTTTMLGVTCTNATAVVGVDEETDEDLRVRCREKLSALSPDGPKAAFSYFARVATRADGTAVGVNRVKVTPGAAGEVSVIVCTPSGGLDDDDLIAVDNSINLNAAPLCIRANVQSASLLTIPITYTVWAHVTSGVSATTLQTAIQDALTDFMANQEIGGNVISGQGYVYADAIRTAIGSAHPSIFHVVLSNPSADVAIGATQVPVLGTITPTAINLVGG